MIDGYVEITSTGFELKEGWQEELLSGLPYDELLRKKKELGSIVEARWFKNGLVKTVSIGVPMMSRSVSDDRYYFSVSSACGVYLYSDDGILVDKMEYPIKHGNTVIESGKIFSQKISNGRLMFKILSENQDFYIVYSIANKSIEDIEWCR